MTIITSFLLIFSAAAGMTAQAAPYIRQQPPPGTHYLTPFGGTTEAVRLVAGLSYGNRVVADGFIPPINDSISVEGDAILAFEPDSGTKDAYIIGGMRWDFHVSPLWTVYARPETGVRFGDRPTLVTPLDLSVGAFYRMAGGSVIRLGYNGVTRAHCIGLAIIH